MLELSWLFVASFLAATVLPAQSELILVGLAARGEHGLASLLAVASVGNTLGSCGELAARTVSASVPG